MPEKAVGTRSKLHRKYLFHSYHYLIGLTPFISVKGSPLLLVLVFLYIAIHSYHTFYRTKLHHYIYYLKYFISVFVYAVSPISL